MSNPDNQLRQHLPDSLNRLVAELRRRGRDAATGSWELVAAVAVVEKKKTVEGFIKSHHISAEHYLGVIDDSYDWAWIVRRQDGSVFERRRIRSFVLKPDPQNVRKSDMAKDWPCSAKYSLHSPNELDRYIEDSSVCRDPKTLEFVRDKDQ